MTASAAPERVVAKDASGELAMTRVTLHPEAQFSGDKEPAAEEVIAMHRDAHEQCFIAQSVKSDVRCEPRSDARKKVEP